jgi:hypothetical protein
MIMSRMIRALTSKVIAKVTATPISASMARWMRDSLGPEVVPGKGKLPVAFDLIAEERGLERAASPLRFASHLQQGLYSPN